MPMNRLLSAVFAAGVVFAPLSVAMAQDAATPAENVEAAPATAVEGDQPAAEPAEAEPAPVAEGEQSVGSEVAASKDAPEEEHAASETPHYPIKKPEELSWSFAGPFGSWDVGQLQRGLKVYKEVCSACHSMNLVSMRNLEALGYNEEQVKAFAAEYQVQDGPNGDGEMFERPGIPADRFPAPFPNPEAAAAANNGAAPPDFSLIAKARAAERGFPTFVFDIFTQYAESGPDYIHALLTGYGEEPAAGVELQPGTYYNPYYLAGPALAMAQPIFDDQVDYPDGAPQTIDQYSRDVSAFLMWAAEPHLAERKATGLVVMLFLIVFAALMFLIKRRVWAGTPH